MHPTMPTRRRIGHAALALTAATAWPAARAQSADGFPTRPVKLMVPVPPGGATDLVGRLLAGKLAEAWGQPVVVENRAGASGMIGPDPIARAPADGARMCMDSGTRRVARRARRCARPASR